jgi:hypothetical protein
VRCSSDLYTVHTSVKRLQLHVVKSYESRYQATTSEDTEFLCAAVVNSIQCIHQ